MGLQELDSTNESSSREELSLMPLNKEFTEELDQDVKYKLNKDGTLTIKNKLVMREGTHNEVHYSWDELKASYLTGEGGGLFYDHEDSVKNYTGLVKNLKLNEAEKAIYGDIHVTNKQAALDISLGAKWGISPTIDAEKLLKDGKIHALDPNFLSYSLVLRPAVRETMLNSDGTERRFNKVEKENEKLLAEKDARIQQLEEAAVDTEKKTEATEKKVEEIEKKVEEAEKKEVEKESEELCALERSIGFTSEAEKDSRLEELKSLSAESRSNLRSAHGKYAKILKLGEDDDEDGESDAEELKENFLLFRTEYMEKNPKATSADVKAAFSKLAATPSGNAPAEKGQDLGEANAQVRMQNELNAEGARTGKVNSNILAYMKEQER